MLIHIFSENVEKVLRLLTFAVDEMVGWKAGRLGWLTVFIEIFALNVEKV